MSNQPKNKEDSRLNESTLFHQNTFSLATSSDKSIDLAEMNGVSQNNSSKTDQNSKKE